MRILFAVITTCLLMGCTTTGKKSHSTNYVPVYQSKASLPGNNYQFVGEISGVSCQLMQQDRPATISEAQSDLSHRAAGKANAVLLKKCDWLNSVGGCHNSAVCVGELVRFTDN